MHIRILTHIRTLLAALLITMAPALPAMADTLVFGGTRGIGLETVRLLAGDGEVVTVLVRETSDLTALNEIDGVSTTVGDAMDMASVNKAFAAGEYQAVVSTLGGSLKGGFAVDSAGNINAIDGAKAAGVKRFVLVTSIGAGDSRAAAPEVMLKALKEVLIGKEKAERHLIDSGLQWTIIRPGFLNDKPRDARGALTQNSSEVGMISRGEVARLVVEVIGSEATFGAIYSAIDAPD